MGEEEGIDLVGVNLQDCVRRRSSMTDPDGNVQEQQQQHAIPENLMSAIEPFIGDGLAKVTVGAELSSNIDFGFKAQAFVSISVTCNNNLDDCGQVHDIVRDVVQRMVTQDHAEMGHARDEMHAAVKGMGQPKEAPGKVAPRPNRVTRGRPNLRR